MAVVGYSKSDSPHAQTKKNISVKNFLNLIFQMEIP